MERRGDIIITERDPRSRFFWGLLLILVGGMGALMYLDLIPGINWNTWWPSIVIAFGLARLVTAYTARKVGSGVSTALLGTWLQLTVLHWHGLDWPNSWPLSLIAVGLGEVAHAVTTPLFRRAKRREEEGIHVHE